jgi:hypothetical protein
MKKKEFPITSTKINNMNFKLKAYEADISSSEATRSGTQSNYSSGSNLDVMTEDEDAICPNN